MQYLTVEEAAAYLGHSYHTIKQYLKLGILTPDARVGQAAGFTTATLDAFRASRRGKGRPPTGDPSRRLTDAEWAEAGKRVHAGETVRAVAALYGVDPAYLHRKIGKSGRPRHAPSRLTDADWAEATRRYHAGETAEAVAAEYGISSDHLRRRVGSRRAKATR